MEDYNSAASRCILEPFERYGRQKKGPEKVLVTFFRYKFHVKTKWNIVYEYLKTRIFPRDTNILPQMHWTSNFFGHSPATHGGFWVSLNYPILSFKKKVCPKNVWMRHCNSTWKIYLKNIHSNEKNIEVINFFSETPGFLF